MPERFDCIVIGAGIAGIDAAYHLSLLKGLTFTVLEKQDGIGGTWRLFQYPGAILVQFFRFLGDFSIFAHLWANMEKSLGVFKFNRAIFTWAIFILGRISATAGQY